MSFPTVKVAIKSRFVTVEGPRGKLTKNLSHLAVNFSYPKKSLINIELHHGARKNVATLRTVRTLINNMIIGVTKGFKYKMRYVYAHFPINVNVSENSETGLYEVEIRNFIGEKIVRKIVMQPGVSVEASKNQKDELQLSGMSIENVSQSAADIQQICRVRNKDIRKVRRTETPRYRSPHLGIGCNPPSPFPQGDLYTPMQRTFMLTFDHRSSWTASTCRRRATSRRRIRRAKRACFICFSSCIRGREHYCMSIARATVLMELATNKHSRP
jgi:large subunit ribosomal protein L9e